MPIHHRSWFPFVLVGLTVSLVLLVALAYVNKQAPKQQSAQADVVTENEYQVAAAAVTRGFFARFDSVANDEERLELVESAQSELLELLVPSAEKDLHLELVMSLNLLKKGLSDDDDAAQLEGRRRLEAVFEQYSWLK